jgi:transposase
MVIGICHRSWEVPVAQRVRARRLTDEEGRQLQQIVRRGKHGSTRVRRALIVMASASGTTVPAIARLVAADEDTVRQVIHRFNEVGLACLDPRWAGGRPRRISPDDEAFIVQAARTRPEKLGRVRFPRFPGGFPSWSTGTRQGGFDGGTTQVPARAAGAGGAVVAL